MTRPVRIVPAPELLRRPTLTAREIDQIELRYRQARAAGDIGGLAILAVETFPALIATARRGCDGQD
jgi:hypothetical protein